MRLYDLVGLAIATGHDADAVFDALVLNRRVYHLHKEISGILDILLSALAGFSVVMLARRTQVTALGHCNHYVPRSVRSASMQDFAHVALNMGSVGAILCGFDVARPSIMPVQAL